MQLFLGAVPIILRLFSKARGHLLFSNYSWNNLPEPSLGLQVRFGFGFVWACDKLVNFFRYKVSKTFK